jgi:hypothetical protein
MPQPETLVVRRRARLRDPPSSACLGAIDAYLWGMTRRQAVLAEMTAAREEARLGSDTLSLEGRQRLYDLEAALDALENRLLAGREIVTDAVLQRGSELARSLLELMRQRAA